MKFRLNGIARNLKKHRIPFMPFEYRDIGSDGDWYRFDRRDCPVIIMHSGRDDSLRWKVIYGFSTTYFKTFKEAMNFCLGRGPYDCERKGAK